MDKEIWLLIQKTFEPYMLVFKQRNKETLSPSRTNFY